MNPQPDILAGLMRQLAALQSESEPVKKLWVDMTVARKEYIDLATFDEIKSYRFKWLPGLNHQMLCPLSPGEMAVIVSDTGVGKTLFLQKMAATSSPLRVLFFEFELPRALLFQRWFAMANNLPLPEAHKLAKQKAPLDIPPCLVDVRVIDTPGMNPQQIEEQIALAKPDMVFIDYLQLVGAPPGLKSSRYEKASFVAEELKVIAGRQKVIMVTASQIARPFDGGNEIHLHSAKDSGSIENSCQFLLGLWRDKENDGTLCVKVNKATRNQPGGMVKCNIDGLRCQINEQITAKEGEEKWFQK